MECGKIYSLIPQVMKECGSIGKDRKNQQQGWMFRGIDDVYNALQAPMAKAGIFCVPEVLEHGTVERQTSKGGLLIYTTMKIKFSFYADDGSHVDAVVLGEAMDSGDKSSNKAMSVAMKYAMMQVFCIPTEDEKDPDTTTHDVAPLPKAEPKAEPKAQAPAKPKASRVDAALAELVKRDCPPLELQPSDMAAWKLALKAAGAKTEADALALLKDASLQPMTGPSGEVLKADLLLPQGAGK